MTVIAWDGKIIASDKMVSYGDRYTSKTKLYHAKDGSVIATIGREDNALEVIDWYESGCNKKEWPESQNGDDWAQLVIIRPDGKCYDLNQRPYLCVVEGVPFAWGVGSEAALGAMLSGKNAKEAVEIANKCINGCGCGVDYYEVIK